jgi:hypothetical protein
LQTSNVLHEVLVRPSQSACLMSPGRIRNTLLMGATWKRQRNIWKRQRNIASLRRNAIDWLSRPTQMAIARSWKKWLRLGEWRLRRRIKSISSRSIVFRQPRLRTLLPNETTLVPCVAAKPALAHLRPCALTLGTLERGGDTDPTLTRRNASPTIATTRKRHRRSFLVAKLTTMRRSVWMEVSKLKEAAN